MILGCKTSETFATQSATARADRNSGETKDTGWLDRATAQFRAAITLSIPAGYQDETGFHCGVPRVGEPTIIISGQGYDYPRPTQF